MITERVKVHLPLSFRISKKGKDGGQKADECKCRSRSTLAERSVESPDTF
jgi:hypothetical protein